MWLLDVIRVYSCSGVLHVNSFEDATSEVYTSLASYFVCDVLAAAVAAFLLVVARTAAAT
jgi:hypothetical protein